MSKTDTYTSNFTLFNLGFRPFFLGAAIYSIFAMLFWMAVYAFNISIPITGLSVFQWHAHEMIFGYSMAVIAGFLLTAIKNWTGKQTVNGFKLAVIFSFWLTARLLFLYGSKYISVAGVFDLIFIVSVIIAATYPVIQSRNWKQLVIISKLLLLAVANACFYFGYTGILEQGLYWGIYGGLFLIISLILTLGSRVIPFFIERGVGYQVQLYNPKWISLSGILIFITLFISELFLHNNNISGICSAGLFIIYSIRLVGWHTSGIWHKPMLWSLFVAMIFIVIGFLLFSLSFYTNVSKFIAIHAFAYGGIGMITLAMMTRVSLGHTGRNVNEPPKTVIYLFVFMLVGSFFRVFLPMLMPDYYLVWIIISQILWIVAFLLFVITFTPILISTRVDHQSE